MRVFIFSVAILTGCASVDRSVLAQASSFSPTASGFQFKTMASTDMQEDNAGAERQRLTVMKQFALRNAVCPNGYSVIDRKVIRRPATWLGVKTLADIIYEARCL